MKTTTVEKDMIVKMYLNGYSPSVIGNTYGVSRQYVRMCLERVGLGPVCQTNKIKASALCRDEIASRFRNGESCQDISIEMGVTEKFVRSCLLRDERTSEVYKQRKKAVSFAKRQEKYKSSVTYKRDKAIHEARANGIGTMKIAELYGISRANVYKILHRFKELSV